MMSKTASSYSTRRLYSGISIAALAALWIFGVSTTILLKQKLVGLWFSLMTLAYGVMMFASSYVEEEHQYWYWVASAWLWWLCVKRYAQRSNTRIL